MLNDRSNRTGLTLFVQTCIKVRDSEFRCVELREIAWICAELRGYVRNCVDMREIAWICAELNGSQLRATSNCVGSPNWSTLKVA